MRLSIYINGQDVGYRSRIRDFSLGRESGGKMTQCSLGIFSLNGDMDAIVTPGTDVLIRQLTSPTGATFDEALFDEAMFGEDETSGGGVAYFRGYVAAIDPEKWGETAVLLKVACQDFTIRLDTLMVTGVNYTTPTADSTIIAALFGSLAPEIKLDEVATVATIPTLKLEGVSLRRAMEMICELTGAEWCLTADNVLRYYTPPAATLSFSDAPDNVATFAYDVKQMKYSQDFRTPANSVRVYGALKTGTTRYSALAEDLTSQTTYGKIFHRTITDNAIKSDAQALLRAHVEVARYANPEENGVITFRRDGVDVGKKIGIVNAALGISGEFIVRKLTMVQLSPTLTAYTAAFGAHRPDIVELLRKLTQMAAPAAEAAVAVPGPASVGNSSIDRTSSDKLQIETGDIKSLAITAEKIANAAITGQQIANVAVKSNHIDDAAVISSKIGDLAVASTHIQNAAIGTDQLANLAVKAANIDNSTITGGKIANLTITAALIADLTITGGKVANATITSAKIADLAVSKLTGWDGAAINVATGGMSITGDGGLELIGTCYLSVEGNSFFTGDVQITDANLYISPGNISVGGGIVASGTSGYFNLGSTAIGYQCNGTTVIDSSRNAEFAGLKWTGNLRVPTNTEAIALSGITTAGWFAVYDASGNYVGKCPYFV